MTYYDVTLVRDVIVTDGSATNSTVLTETAAAVLVGPSHLAKPLAGYTIAGQWRVVAIEPREEKEATR